MKAEYNSKLDKNMEGFIYKRIEGKSFDEIATDLKTTKQTLIEWNKKELVRNAIDEGKAIKINNLIKTYKFDLSNRVNAYLQLSKKINDELLSRDLKEINTDILLKMSITHDTRLKELIGKPIEFGNECNVSSFTTDNDDYFKMALDE